MSALRDWVRENWGYIWLMLIALCASAFRLPDILRDAGGKLRYGMLFIQLPTAFAISVVGHALTPIALHFVPYAGESIVDGLVGVLAFAGPLGIIRGFDALVARGGKT